MPSRAYNSRYSVNNNTILLYWYCIQYVLAIHNYDIKLSSEVGQLSLLWTVINVVPIAELKCSTHNVAVLTQSCQLKIFQLD